MAALVIGRDSELDMLSGVLDGLPDRGGALVLRGEAGIGKSVLLEAARRMADKRRVRVLHTAGVAAESDLSFSGLHRLLRPVLHGADGLPASHRSALLGAFGIGDEPGGDPFLVALAVLDLLSARAARQPLLVIADDLHWLDAPSRDAIAFVARRVVSDPIVVLVAWREGYEEEVGDLGIDEHALARLGDEDAAAVLDSRAPGLSPGLRARVLREADGNPLALVELPVAAAGGAGDDTALPLNARLERAFAARLRDLPDDTAALLLVASADQSIAISEVLAGGEILLGRSTSLATLQPAVEARLVSFAGNSLEFRHPLVRSAIYQAADAERRTAVHAALAQLFASEPDRRAFHRAAAAIGPDDSVAHDVEDMAERARRRGAALQASDALARAARLSADPAARVRRLLGAAEQAFEAGRVDRVRDLVGDARRESLSEHDSARADWLTEIFDDGSGPGQGDVSRVLHLVDVARGAAAAGDRELAVALLLAAALRTWWGSSPMEVGRKVAATAGELPGPNVDAGQVAAMAIADPLGHAPQVEALIRAALASGPIEARTAQLLGQAAHCIFDNETALRMHVVASERLREHGRLALLAQTAAMIGVDSLLLGDWGVATTAAAEAIRLAQETGQPIWLASAHGTMAAVTGIRGNFEAAEALLADGVAILDAAGTRALLGWLQVCRGFVDLSAGRYDEASSNLARVFDPGDPAHHRYDQFMAASMFADAALGCGERDDARAVLGSLTELAGSRSTIGLRLGLLYAEPLLAPDEEAEGKFLAALTAPWSERPFERARLLLAYGMWLRRHRRMADSREPLRLARDRFDAMGAPTWGDRARQELRAAGETSRKRQPEAWDELSPQELQIATMAAAGMSNREIGQQLYISHRTVASHLYRIFPKLGIASRGQLAAVLPDQQQAPVGSPAASSSS